MYKKRFNEGCTQKRTISTELPFSFLLVYKTDNIDRCHAKRQRLPLKRQFSREEKKKCLFCEPLFITAFLASHLALLDTWLCCQEVRGAWRELPGSTCMCTATTAAVVIIMKS